MSTISGNLSKQTSVAERFGPPSMLRTMLAFLVHETDAFAAHSGVHVKASNVETDTDPNGFFALTGAFSGAVLVSFVSESRAFTLPVEVPPGGTVILRDVDLREDGTARANATGFRIRGTIASVSCEPMPRMLSIALGKETIKVEIDDTTRIQIPDGTVKDACKNLGKHIGERVRVEGDRSKEGTLLADRVNVSATADLVVTAPEIEFRGGVGGLHCPDRLTVQRTDGQTVGVRIDRSTRLEGALSCDDLAGASIRVEGTLQEDGRVLARGIEAED